MVGLRFFKTVYYSAFHVLLHILIDILEDVGESDVYPLLITTVEQGTPLMFAERSVGVKFAMQQFRDFEATKGWWFVIASMYNFEGSHVGHRFAEHTGVIAVPDRLPGKVPRSKSYSHKTLNCSIPLSMVGCVLWELTIVPPA